jgi:hypothetical protein
LQTNLRKLEPANDFKLQDVLHCQVHVQHHVDTPSEERVPAIGHKAVRSAEMKYFARPECVLSSINEKSFFADPKHRVALERDVSRQAVLLTVHNAQAQPPKALIDLDYASVCASGGPAPNIVFETKTSKFESCTLPDGRTRWCSTQIITNNVSRAELEIALQSIALAVAQQSRGLASVYCHGLVMKCQTWEVARLLPSVSAGEDFVDSSTGIRIPWAGSNKLVLALMSSQIPPTSSKSAQYSAGLKLLPGTSPSLYLNGPPRSFIAEKPYVFVTTDPRLDTIADLLDAQLTGVESTQDRAAKMKQLNIMLQGLQVKARVSTNSDEFATRIVSVVYDGNSQSAPFRSRPDLPCVNVGSSQVPQLLDPTLCALVPNQDLRGGQMPSLARSIENIRRTDIPTTSATTGSVNGWLFPRRNNKGNSGAIDILQTISDELEGGLPKVLLLEAGTQDFNSPSYVQLRQTLKERFEGVSRRPREDIPTLSLKYENTSDIESLWTHQIRRFVSKHENPLQRMLLVMCVQAGGNAAQYGILKRACDVQVGIPSISVNRDTLVEKSDDPAEAAAMVVGSICLKLRLRNSPTLTKPPNLRANNSRHLVIGIHVKPFTPPGPDVLENGGLRKTKKEMILVVLVSRALESSVDYHTEVKLYSKSDFENLGVTALLQPFLDSIKSPPCDLSILRTGYLVDGSATSDALATSKADRLVKERNDIAKAYTKIPNHRAFKYATLSEDKVLKVDRGGQDRRPNYDNLLIARLGAREDPGQSNFWVFHDKDAADSPPTGIKVTFIPEVASLVSSQTTNSLGAVVRQQEHDARLDMTAPDLPTTPQLSHVPNGLINPPPPSGGGPAGPPAPSNNTVARATSPDEVDLLGRIWMDDRLALYDTKWPTPTHLAKLALKRARMHLISNDWENENHGQTAPVYLPEVHRNVRDTLYYN